MNNRVTRVKIHTPKEKEATFMNEWEGSKQELREVIDEMIDNIKMDLDLRISDRQMRKLFLESLSRNVVQCELKSMIEYVAEAEGIL